MRTILVILLAIAAAWAQDQPPTIASLLETGNAAYMKGDYAAARESFSKAWELAEQTADEDPSRYDVAKRLSSVCAAQGAIADADNYLYRAIVWREKTFGPNDPKLADDLIIQSGFYRSLKDYDRARQILERVLRIHMESGPPSAAVADVFSRIGRLHLEQKNLEKAIGPLKTALGIRTKLAGPLDGSLIPDLDRLGAAHVTMRAYDQAETTYRHALVIRETLLGKDDADLIATVDGLAYSCFGLKKYDEAEALYQRLVALWVKSVDPDHPMVALALDKLATFYRDQKKLDQAKETGDRAVAIRARFLALGLTNAAAVQLQEQHKEAAIAHYRRAVNAMEPVHPVTAGLHRDILEMLKGLVAAPPKPATPRPQRKK